MQKKSRCVEAKPSKEGWGRFYPPTTKQLALQLYEGLAKKVDGAFIIHEDAHNANWNLVDESPKVSTLPKNFTYILSKRSI